MKNVLQKAKDLKEQAQEAGKGTAQAAIDAALGELQGLKPILSQCGFTLGDISISLTLPPSCVVAIMHDHEAATSLESLAAREDLTKVQSLVVGALKNAYAFSGTFQKYGYAIGKLSLEVGLIPKVTVHLTNVGSR